MSSPAEHAILSASSAKRWMNCPGAPRLEETFPDRESSYAAEGTYAHSFGETLLRQRRDKPGAGAAKAELASLRRSEYYNEQLEVDVNTYVDAVWDAYKAARRKDKSAVLLLEQRLDLSSFIPEGFGTSDAVLIYNDTLQIFDLKFGRGVKVEAEGNPQMRIYAAGAVSALCDLYDVERVITTIVQPRVAGGVSSEELTVDALGDWISREVVPAAEKAFAGCDEYNPGEWCRFCRAAGTCSTRANQYTQEIKAAFAEAQAVLLSSEEIAQILRQIPEWTRWMTSVKDDALSGALSGESYPGLKLVAGRSTRAYSDQVAVLDALHGAGVEDAIIFTREMQSPAKLEKSLGKKTFSEILGNLVEVAPGKPALVPEEDRREALIPGEELKNQFLKGNEEYED